MWLFHTVFLHSSINGNSRCFRSGAIVSVGCYECASLWMAVAFVFGVHRGAEPLAHTAALQLSEERTRLCVNVCFRLCHTVFVFRSCSCSVPLLSFLLCHTLIRAMGYLRAASRLAQTLSLRLFAAQVSLSTCHNSDRVGAGMCACLPELPFSSGSTTNECKVIDNKSKGEALGGDECFEVIPIVGLLGLRRTSLPEREQAAARPAGGACPQEVESLVGYCGAVGQHRS